jgi:hypothetical protein
MEALPNPVITEDAEAELLLSQAHAEDTKPYSEESEENPSPEPQEEPIASELELEESEPTAEELADPANQDRARDPITGKFVKKAEAIAEPKPVADAAAKTDPPAPVLSEFEQKKLEKAAKEKERQDRSWENLNREKEELAQRRREFDERQRQISQPQQQRQQPRARQYSSQQLLEAHQDFKRTAREAFKRYQETGNEADLDAFNQNDQWADQAFANAGEFYQLEQREAQQQAVQQHHAAWVGNMEKSIQKNPDLAKIDSPIAIEVQEILKTHGQVLQMLPDGFDRAVELGQLRLDAKDAPSLREKIAAVQKENERLTALTSPSKGGVTGAPAKKSFDSMSLEEMGNELRHAAELADGS